MSWAALLLAFFLVLNQSPPSLTSKVKSHGLPSLRMTGHLKPKYPHHLSPTPLPYQPTLNPLSYHHPSPTPLPYHRSPTPLPHHSTQSPLRYRPSPTPLPYHRSPTPLPYHTTQSPIPYKPSPTSLPYPPSPNPYSYHVSPTPFSYKASPALLAPNPTAKPISKHPHPNLIPHHPPAKPLLTHMEKPMPKRPPPNLLPYNHLPIIHQQKPSYVSKLLHTGLKNHHLVPHKSNSPNQFDDKPDVVKPYIPHHLPPSYVGPYEAEYQVPKEYNFVYSVKDDYQGEDFSHKETKSGYTTNGEYRVALPDGRIQIVTYTADDDGYHATVEYEGQAHYDAPNPHYDSPKPHFDSPNPHYGSSKPLPDYTIKTDTTVLNKKNNIPKTLEYKTEPVFKEYAPRLHVFEPEARQIAYKPTPPTHHLSLEKKIIALNEPASKYKYRYSPTPIPYPPGPRVFRPKPHPSKPILPSPVHQPTAFHPMTHHIKPKMYEPHPVTYKTKIVYKPSSMTTSLSSKDHHVTKLQSKPALTMMDEKEMMEVMNHI